jgi:hypothetical protein
MNDIDLLMTRITEINAKSPLDLGPPDIANLIAYYRQIRARKAAGEKPARLGLEKPGPKVSLNELMELAGSTLTTPATPSPSRITRR